MNHPRLRSLALLVVLPILLGGVAPVFAQEATPASPSDEIIIETVARVRLPASAIPPPPAIVDVWLWSLIPNEELRFATEELPPSIAADVVLAGEYSVRSEGQLQVQRATGVEEVPAGTAVTVRPGDVVIYVENQAAQVMRNTGDEVVQALSFGVFSAAPPSPLVVGPVSQEDWARSGLAGQDLLVRVERLTVPPEASVPNFVPDVHAPRIFAVVEGVVRRVHISPGVATPSSPAPSRQGQVLWFRTLGECEYLHLRNDEDQSLVLLQVTLSAADAATPVAATPTS